MKKIIIGIAVILIAVVTIFLNLPEKESESPKLKKADPLAADMILVNLAGAMRAYSAMNGGGGCSKFAKNISEIEHTVVNKIKAALPGPGQTSFDGYIVRLEENPQGDNFATNFLLVAYPAVGYEGDVFTIDKAEKVKKVEKK